MAADADIWSWFCSVEGIVGSTAGIAVCLAACVLFTLLGCSDGRPQAHDDSCSRAGTTLSISLMTLLSSLAYTPPVQGLLIRLGIPAIPAGIAAAVLIFILFAVLATAIGQLVPQKLAMRDTEKLSSRYAGVFSFLSAFMAPFTALCAGIASLFGQAPDEHDKTKTEEQILMMVDRGEEDGIIEENTKSMIEKVFDFDDTTVGAIMTHRKDVVAVEDKESIAALTKVAIQSGRSRIPVYHEEIDNIVGIIYAKDLLQFVSTDAPDETIRPDMIREAVFVPESKRCREMFEYMTKHKIQIAVVVDEFGGTGGIITMEDLIESILGNIQDEYDNEKEDIQKVSEHSFKVDGATSLDEISDLTGICFDDEENDTIAGIMLDRMGHIPKNGEHPSIMINGTRFTVLKVENRRIAEILVVKKTS